MLLRYLAGYPPALLGQVRTLIARRSMPCARWCKR